MRSLLLAALLTQVPAPESAQELRAPTASVAVVEHAGDAALRDRLVRAMEVWHDAGDFLVGSADAGLLEALVEREVAARALPDVLPDDELFVVDLEHDEVRAALGRGARLVYTFERQGLVAVVSGAVPRPAGFEPGRVCHGGLVAVRRRAWLPAAAPTLAGGVAPPAKAAAIDARITALVMAAAKAGIEADVQMLSGNYSRNSGVASYIDAARDQIVARLQALGYAPQTIQFSSSHGDNVQVEIPGLTAPDEWVVIGAHYDSANSSGSSAPAPGADDNASGSAAVLEIARVLKAAGPFERSIRLIWFAGEEYGLLGSDAAAQASKAAGETVVGMLNTDMNAYRASGDTRDVDFATNSTSAALTDLCDAVGALYVPGWASKKGILTAGTSDHASYTAAGYPAVFPFEDFQQSSPYIHSSGDTYPQSTPDFDLSLMITRGVLATAAVLAEPVDLSIAHTPLPDTTNALGPYVVSAQVTSLIGSTVSSVTLHYSTDGQSYGALPMTASGSDWTAAIPSQGSPLTISYYIAAVDSYAYPETLPEGADLGAPPFSFFVGTKTVLYANGFEGPGDAGWTHAQVATQDDWQRGVPQGKAGDPAAAFEGSQAWGNDLGASGWNGAYSNDVVNWLRSPTIDCSQASSVALELRRWLTVESGQYDKAQVRVNGQVVWENPATVDLIDSSWMPVSIDVSTLAAGNAAVQVEFRLDTDGGLTFGGWNLDAFQLVELGPGTGGCPAPTTYCTSKSTSIAGCLPALGFNGTPSATAGAGFVVSASPTPGGNAGLFLYTTKGPAASPATTPYGSLCLTTGAGLFRIAPQNSGGTTGLCDGQFTVDFNAYAATQTLDPNLVAGAQVDVQCWYRDPANIGGANLTEAGSFLLCP